MIFSARRGFFVVIFMGIFLSACGGGGSGGSTEERRTDDVERSLVPTSLSSASTLSPGAQLLIKDAKSLDALKLEGVDSSEIDFSRETVLGGSLANPDHTGSRVHIETVSFKGGKLQVHYRELQPQHPTGLVMEDQIETYPTHFIKVDIPPTDVREAVFLREEDSRNVGVEGMVTTIDWGVSFGVVQDKKLLIRDEASFNALVKEHFGELVGGHSLDTSSVDFSRNSVVAVFETTPACGRLLIENASLTSTGTLVIDYRRLNGPVGCVETAVLRTALHLVTVKNVLPSSVKQVVFNAQASGKRLLSFEFLDSNSFMSAVDFPNAESVSDLVKMNQVWTMHNGSREISQPQIDFDKYTVAHLYGEMGDSCSDLEVLAVEDGKNLEGKPTPKVFYKISRSQGACLTVMTYRSLLFKVPVARATFDFRQLF